MELLLSSEIRTGCGGGGSKTEVVPKVRSRGVKKPYFHRVGFPSKDSNLSRDGKELESKVNKH